MWTTSRNEEKKEARREELLQKGFELFSTKTIETVSMRDVASAVGCGSASIYRYYGSKPDFVVAVATWKWKQVQPENRKRRPSADLEGMTAAEIFEFYLDSFLALYRENTDLLRFNQFFNVYVQAEHIGAETLQPYQEMIAGLRKGFHGMYLKAEHDKTLRTDEPEEKMFSKTLHLMLAAVTRYAVGLVYIPEKGFDAMEELEFLKNAIMREYRGLPS